MKALTLHQPWASLIAHGFKKIETRSWGTYYRGELAIHAAKDFPKYAKEAAHDMYANWNGFREMGYTVETLPRGYIVAKVNLVNCVPMTDANIEKVSNFERSLGFYEPNRCMWILEDIEQIDPPIPIKGKQGLWECELDLESFVELSY